MQMAGARVQRKRTIFWQAILILLPVAVLAAFGWVSLRQDKALAEHDAAARAQAIADELLPKLWNELAARGLDRSSQLSFEVTEAGQLIFPPPCTAVPVPQPFHLAALDAEQARLWARIGKTEAARGADAGSLRVLKDFLASNPPEEFSAAARYDLGLVLEQRGEIQGAIESFSAVLEQCPGSTGESGIPLEPLARLKLLELVAQTNLLISLSNSLSVDFLCSNAVYHPTPLTPELLRRAGVLPTHAHQQGDQDNALINGQARERWQRVWQTHELTRRLFSAAQSVLPHPCSHDGASASR